MKLVMYISATLIAGLVAFCQNEVLDDSTVIYNFKDVFDYIDGYKNPPIRGEFEILEDYQKRFPPPYDYSKIWYISLEEQDNFMGKSYIYDIDKQLLTFTGGKIYEGKKPNEHSALRGLKLRENKEPNDYSAHRGFPMLVEVELEELDSYEATNAFGATISVEKSHVNKYVLNFKNWADIPEAVFNRSNGVFSYTIKKPPKEAEQLSKQLRLAIRVLPGGPLHCSREQLETRRPTIEDPYKTYFWLYWLNVKFIDLVLYDINTHEIKESTLINMGISDY